MTQRQWHITWDQIHCISRTFKGQGAFKEASECFEKCLAMYRFNELKRVLIKSQLTDVYIELDYEHENVTSAGCLAPSPTFLDKAEEVVISETEYIKGRGKYWKAYRRLLLASIEVEIRRSRFAEAKILITEILEVYDSLQEPDIVDRVGYVRALIARARVFLLPEAENCWTNILHCNKKYNPLEEDVFIYSVMYLFICCVRYQLGKLDAGRTAYKRAMSIVYSKRPQFLILNVGSYLFDSVLQQIRHIGLLGVLWDV